LTTATVPPSHTQVIHIRAALLQYAKQRRLSMDPLHRHAQWAPGYQFDHCDAPIDSLAQPLQKLCWVE
jgi:hypothetical protein